MQPLSVDRIWGVYGDLIYYHIIPKAIFYLLKGAYGFIEAQAHFPTNTGLPNGTCEDHGALKRSLYGVSSFLAAREPETQNTVDRFRFLFQFADITPKYYTVVSIIFSIIPT